MLKLLLLRATPLFLRPAAVIFEGAALKGGGHILVLILPIAMMALTIFSIPVHLDYFKSHSRNSNHNQLALKYISALTWLTCISILLLIIALSLLPLGLDASLICAVCLVFLIEKLADEASRSLEFRKLFGKWFFIQALRSGWFFLPVIATQVGVKYDVAFLISAFISCSAMYFVFQKTLGLVPRLRLEGISLIRDNLVFLVGSLLPASYRQLPRIFIAKRYPEQAHIFLAMAQLSQSIGLFFNVKFQIPYRKIIARRTYKFERALQPIMLKIIFFSGLTAIIYFIPSLFFSINEIYGITLAMLLCPILIADAMTFAIFSAYLGYLPWIAKKRTVMNIYFLSITAALFLITLISTTNIVNHINLTHIPMLTMITGFVWLALIYKTIFYKLDHAV